MTEVHLHRRCPALDRCTVRPSAQGCRFQCQCQALHLLWHITEIVCLLHAASRKEQNTAVKPLQTPLRLDILEYMEDLQHFGCLIRRIR